MDKIMLGYMHKPSNDVYNTPTVIKHASILPPDEYALGKGLNEYRQEVSLAKEKMKEQDDEIRESNNISFI